MVGETIALQAGQNIPAYGPDFNALANAQRTAVYVQQAQQQVQAENALRALYSDPSNYDPKTQQPTPEALNRLYAVSPQAGMTLQKNALAMQQQQTRMRFEQGQIAKQYRDEQVDIAAKSKAAYVDALKTMPPDQALRVGQQMYTSLMVPFRQNLPPELAAQVSPTFDPQRVDAVLMTAARMKDIDDKWETREDYGHLTPEGKPTEYSYNAITGQSMDLSRKGPYTPTGVGKPTQAAEPDLWRVNSKTAGNNLPAIRDPQSGAFIDPQSRQPIPNVTDFSKAGTKPGAETGGEITPTGPTDLHGEDYLKALPASRAALIKGYAEGRVPIPSSFALGKPAWEKVIADLTQYDPSFDAVNYKTRETTRKQFTAQGMPFNNLTAINAAIGHLGSMDAAIDKLNNSDYPWWNYASNWANVQGGNTRFQAALKDFETARTAVSGELDKAFRGSGVSVTGIEHWRQNINSADSPAALHASVREAINLLNSRFDTLGEQYKQGMGTTADPLVLLTPKTKETLAKLPGGEVMLGDQGARGKSEGEKSPASSAAPKVKLESIKKEGDVYHPSSEDEYAVLPSGSYYFFPGKGVLRKP